MIFLRVLRCCTRCSILFFVSGPLSGDSHLPIYSLWLFDMAPSSRYIWRCQIRQDMIPSCPAGYMERAVRIEREAYIDTAGGRDFGRIC